MPEQDIFEEDQVDVNVDAAEENSVTINEYRSSITIGNVETLNSGESAYVTNSGTESDVILNFGLPKGSSGTTWGDIDGTLSDQTDLQTVINQLASRINALEQALPPVGSVISSTVNSMAGWILCAGQEVSRTTYSALFNAIGIGFGAGDGVSTFNVPDYRGCFLRGLGGNSGLDVYTKQDYQGSDHYHIFGYNSGNNNGSFAASNGSVSQKMPVISQSAGARGWNGSGGGGGYAGDVTDYGGNMITTIQVYAPGKQTTKTTQEIRPVNYAVNYFIKF